MKRSQINRALTDARSCFEINGWHLPPNPKWDVCDFGRNRFENEGLVLLNLAEEPEYCEKLMYARRNQVTLAHTHRLKKEDIICRAGELEIQLWKGKPHDSKVSSFQLQVNGDLKIFQSGQVLTLNAGERITLIPGIYHSFWPRSEECVIGEVSTANDDLNDNLFAESDIARFPSIEEDEPPLARLISERDQSQPAD
ncbi:hypothetical protein VDG1235_4167 [Verrucomicrobiia bacterium DG1235]|nr:hypothetical protein VDG1235_4167 [Verrucomicrobiae bacterium DG1235]